MIERLSKLALVIIVAIALAYSGLWFYRADVTERFLAGELDKFKNFSLGTLNYSDIKVTGYPFAFTITLRDLELGFFDQQAASQKQIQVILPKLVIDSSLLGNRYDFRPVGVPQIINAQGDKAEITWNAPLLTLGLQNGFMVQLLRYEDKGFDIITDRGEKLLSGTGASLHFSRNRADTGENIQLMLHAALQRGEGFNRFTGQVSTGKDIAIDVEVSGRLSKKPDVPQYDVALTVTEAALVMDEVDFRAKGTATGPGGMFYSPDAQIDMQFLTTDYGALLDAMVVNGWTDQASRIALEKLLPDITGNYHDKDLVVNVVHTPGEKEVFLGKLTLKEAESRFNKYLQEAASPQSLKPTKGNGHTNDR